jgi:3-oxoacyl-(acyl-carrier-protein) synthase
MRAAITGWAWRTPLGDTVPGVVQAMLMGARAATSSHRFPLESYPCSLVAPIAGEPKPSRHRRFMRRLALFAAEAAAEAFKQSGIAGAIGRGERFGLFSAMGGLRADWDELMPALAKQREDGEEAWDRGFCELHPFWMLRYLSNNVHALMSADLGARGEGVAFGGANAGAQAMASAARALAAGSIDAALVVAYDSLIEPETLVELGTRGEATRASLDALEAPYGSRAEGFVPGEAAAAIVIEREDSAGERANSFVVAASGSDGARGEPGARAIGRVVARVARPGDAVIDGAARAAPELDAAEREAIAGVVGRDSVLMATSASIGRAGAPSALIQAIALSACLREGALPPIAGLREAAPGPLRPQYKMAATRARSAVGVSTGPSGAVSAVRVELP